MHLTGPHEWNPAVLDYSYPSGDGEPTWSTDPNERFALDPKSDEFGDYTERVIQTLNILDDSFQHMTLFQPLGLTNMFLLPINMFLAMTPTNMFLVPINMFSAMALLIMNTSDKVLVGSMLTLFRKPLNSPPNGESQSHTFPHEETPQV